MKTLLITALALLMAQPASAAAPLAGQTIRVCDDANEWPPYSYLQREAGRQELRGFSVDLVKSIFAKHGISVQIDLLPWKRCLREVSEGRQYQMLLNAAATPEREAEYLLSLPYHQTHSYYFYLKRRYPKGLKLKSSSELQGYTMGGVRGYAYPALPATAREQMLRTGNYSSLFRMLQLGRVDLLVEDFEAMQGLARTGAIELPGEPAIAYAPLPGVAPSVYHLMFTRQRPTGAALQALFNTELQQMQASGELDRRLARYLAP
ncbi:transporter substrate-binding domain-containing protein [Paucibacter sp. APW11]|uniref:Transporter substrate-binding domain-containing protein n=1 Tax=Roseateles aquae TaxID=3077235 RepID=A0ABU3PGX7_9BURK|nr:transporter substrate-binding domain-containing protein [Paucibacter sp. APW11]MDT9001640.1 transporter substrate-binding domain-containing protein [Paucibacter sp. APW11]